MTTTVVASTHHPGTAAVLSLIVPGIGQIYNGDFLRGIFWLIVTPGFWITTGGFLGWVCHLVSSYTAYRRARDRNLGFASATFLITAAPRASRDSPTAGSCDR